MYLWIQRHRSSQQRHFTRPALLGSALLLAASLFINGCATGPTADEQAGKPEVQQRYDAALKQVKRKKWQKAENLLLAMTQDYGELSGPFLNLALVYLKTDRYPQALDAVDAAIDRNPNRAEAHNLRGVILRSQGSFSAAEDAYNDALKINTEYAFAHLNLAILYDEHLDEPAKAVQAYYLYRETSKKLSEGERAQLVYWLKLLDIRMTGNNNV